MRKTFSFILVCIFAFLVSSIAQANTCGTCHDSASAEAQFTPSTVSNVASAEGLTLDIHPNFNVPQMVSGAGGGTFFAGKTSRSIEPFFTADIPYPYTQSDYLEEPGNPITDEESLYAGTALTKIKLE